MKKRILLSILFAGFLFVTNLSAQEPTFEWAKQIGGSGIDLAQSITTDAKGNVYVTGGFANTDLIAGNEYDIFIQKLEANGTLLWDKRMGGKG